MPTVGGGRKVSAVHAYFDRLREWKKLPAYKAEPRVDAIVGLVLPGVLRALRGWEVDVLIPEFPLRLGTLAMGGATDSKNDNRSFKADFFVRTACGKNLLIEFKTDMSSRRTKQDDYLLAAQEVGLRGLVDGVAQLEKHSKATEKYGALMEQLGRIESAGLAADDAIDILYVQPLPPGEGGGWGFLELADAMRETYPDDAFIGAAAETFELWGEEAAKDIT